MTALLLVLAVRLDTLDDHALWLTAVVAGCGALGWAARKGQLAARWVRRQAREWAARFAALEGLVHHELHPNSGTSVKDSLARIEARLDGVDGRAYLTAGLLSQHVAESRDYLDRVTAGLAAQGVTLPDPAPPNDDPPPHPPLEEA